MSYVGFSLKNLYIYFSIAYQRKISISAIIFKINHYSPLTIFLTA